MISKILHEQASNLLSFVSSCPTAGNDSFVSVSKPKHITQQFAVCFHDIRVPSRHLSNRNTAQLTWWDGVSALVLTTASLSSCCLS